MSPGLPVATLPAAKAWIEAGGSVLKIRPGGQKKPATEWKQYTIKAPTLDDVIDWFGNGVPYGLAVIMGAVSGNLEMTEIEGIAARDTVLMGRIWDKIDEYDAYDVWHIVHNGYLEESPSGGLHFIYRITDHPVPGNEKIARRPATEAEIQARPGDKIKVLVETRGEGGYVIVAPTSGLCHPSGEAWKLLAGEAGVVPEITWEQRELLHRVFREALDEMPEPVAPAPVPSTTVATRDGLSPGDDFDRRVSWDEILQPHGWTVLSRQLGGETHWVRPGKDPRDGMSATTGHANDRDRLYVFSTSTEFQAETPYTKLGAYAVLEHHGDYRAAAQALARMGFGEQRISRYADSEAVMMEGLPASTIDNEPDNHPRKVYSWDDDGNGARLWDTVRGRSLFVQERKSFVSWNGEVWADDYEGAKVHQAFMKIKLDMIAEARTDGNDAYEKWARKCGMEARRNAAVSTMKKFEGVVVKDTAFDRPSALLNLRNGVYDTDAGQLLPHDPSYMMTRTFGVAYDPEATCPTWDQYLKDVLPEESMRRYVQRAVGYTLLGEANRRSIFFIHGPGGTGKSTFMETIQAVFGDYGGTAAPGAFRAKRDSGGPTNDLHGLKGKRFVATSETTESTSFEEDLLKRLAGGDRISSRDLYQSNQEWQPECVLWLATNHAPRFNSDDDAMWQRAKLIPFLTKLTGAGEIPDMRKRLLAEAAGIFNWMLAGLAAFQADGLGEPEEVQAAVKASRQDSDPVQRFMVEKVGEGVLELDDDSEIASSELYEMYRVWSLQSGERALGPSRFRNRIESSGSTLQYVRRNTRRVWRGVRRATGVSILGSMET